MAKYFVSSVERLVIFYANITREKILSNRKKNRIILLNKPLPVNIIEEIEKGNKKANIFTLKTINRATEGVSRQLVEKNSYNRS
jgi:hypothetical protein